MSKIVDKLKNAVDKNWKPDFECFKCKDTGRYFDLQKDGFEICPCQLQQGIFWKNQNTTGEAK